MTGALDQPKFGATVGSRHEVTGIGVRNLDVLRTVTDHEPTRRDPRNGRQRVDGEDVVAK